MGGLLSSNEDDLENFRPPRDPSHGLPIVTRSARTPDNWDPKVRSKIAIFLGSLVRTSRPYRGGSLVRIGHRLAVRAKPWSRKVQMGKKSEFCLIWHAGARIHKAGVVRVVRSTSGGRPVGPDPRAHTFRSQSAFGPEKRPLPKA